MKVELKISTKVGEAIVSEEFTDIAQEAEWEKYNKMVYMANTIIGTFGQPSWLDNKGVSDESKSAKKSPKTATESKPEVQLATPKQLEFIKKYLGQEIDPNTSRTEAADLIRKFKKDHGWGE